MLVYALVAGVLFGLYFSLVGIGLNLVFGVMRIVNLAHGDFLMLGAFVAFGVVRWAGSIPCSRCRLPSWCSCWSAWCCTASWCRVCRLR